MSTRPTPAAPAAPVVMADAHTYSQESPWVDLSYRIISSRVPKASGDASGATSIPGPFPVKPCAVHSIIV